MLALPEHLSGRVMYDPRRAHTLLADPCPLQKRRCEDMSVPCISLRGTITPMGDAECADATTRQSTFDSDHPA
jgi:hypothetical protein